MISGYAVDAKANKEYDTLMPEIPRVEQAHYVRDFTIHIRFSDGMEGDVDLGDELHGELFEPLKDRVLFQRFTIHPEFHTLTWPNGADLAPEFLYEKVQISA
jgi:hypothetical protein